MSPDLPRNLEEQFAELRSRIYRLEETLRSHGIEPSLNPKVLAPPAPQRQEPTTTENILQSPPAQNPAPRPTFALSAQSATEDHRTLENRIGSQWFNRVGILAVLIGMAWFLKLAVDNDWVGPLGRILIGLVAGGSLIAWSERFRSRGYALFSYSLKAVGSGILYLSLWAAFSLFHLLPSSVAFAAMILVTAFNAFMAWRQDTELLALYAIVGGFSTPLLLSTGENHEVVLFTYLFLLNLAALVLVALRPWSRLLFGSFLGTIFFFTGWYLQYYSNLQFTATSVFLTLFFLIFALAPRLVKINGDINDHSSWDNLALVLLPIANASLTFLTFYAMLESSNSAWAEPWLAVAFAAFYLGMLRLPAKGRLQAPPALLSELHLAITVIFLTIAIPLKAHGRWLTIGWLVEGAALLWVATRTSSRLLRVMALLCLALGVSALLILDTPASTTPFFNQRFGTYCVAIAAFAFAAWVAIQAPAEAPDPDNTLPWLPSIAAATLLIVNLLILIAIGWEIHNYWWLHTWNPNSAGEWNRIARYEIRAQFTYSAFFMLYGAILLTLGFWRRSAFLRWQAMVLLALTIGKVFLLDISKLSQGFRVLSFLGLGALLLAVSFIYQRDWLNLRKPPTTSETTSDEAKP